MFLYKIEITMPEGKKAALIVLADSDAKAFEYAEGHLARHYIKAPEVLEMVMLEKKRVEKGSGYVIETV
ncbi:DUF3906 family protein [Gorillibacterium sp. sgz5001074]|uniref:DUF3906 family protein n=1 Tax=Gorillibacterium sp. sgz5001074 TaxID=3446695 RepID=UPI003F66B9DC